MANTTVFQNLPASFQFLHVCHYINSIGLLLSNDSTSNKKHQIVPVLNSFFEYLSQSENETQAKQILLQKVLNGTDLYGGNKDELLDTEYIDKTYHYIINKALFSPYGGVTGYLASIVNEASSLNFKDFKKTVRNHFSKIYKNHDPCSLSKRKTNLRVIARKKILEDYILSILPKPEQNLNITDVNYIYAMAGYKIVKAFPIKDQLNFTFDEYIQLSRNTEIAASQHKSYPLVLEFFSTPALFFYASKEKVKFKKQNLTSLNAEFWNDAYQTLFSYLNQTVEMLVQDAFKNSLHYKLQTEISKIKTRTALAETFIKIACPHVQDPVSLKYLIERYKSQSVTGALLSIETVADLMDYYYYNCSNFYLPNLNQLFYTQFDNVRNTYYEIEKNSIQQSLAAGGLLKKINSPNVSVERAKLPDIVSFCGTCGPNLRSIKEDIYFFFAIKQDSKTEFYAFKQEESTLTLIKNGDNEENFARALGVDSSIKPQTETISIFLKKQNENSTVFVEGLAKIKTDQYISQLQEYYYERTLVEKVMNGLISLVPFYTCVSGINSGKAAESITSCSVDFLSLIPIAGVATKYLPLVKSSLTFMMRKTFKVFKTVSRGSITSKVAIRTGVSEIFQVARTVMMQIPSEAIIRDFAIAFLRTVDPGIEMFYSLSRFGIRFLRRLFNNILLYTKSIKSFRNFSAQLKLMLRFLRRVRSKDLDYTGMVPRILGREPGLEVVRYTYPEGVRSFGPKCLKVFGHTAEMRTSFKDRRQIPVVPTKINGDVVYYKKIDLDTGKLLDHDLMLDNNDLLRRIKNSVKLMEMEALGNQVRNYDVYYNTIVMNQPKKRKFDFGNSQGASSSAARNKVQGSTSQGQKSTQGQKPGTSMQENQRFDSEDDLDYQPGPSQKKKTSKEEDSFLGETSEVLDETGLDKDRRIMQMNVYEILDEILEHVNIDDFNLPKGHELVEGATGQERNIVADKFNMPGLEKDTRIRQMDVDENLDEILRHLNTHDSNLQKGHELVEGATGQERHTVGDASNIETPDSIDIDKFISERAKELDVKTQQTNTGLKSNPNSVNLSVQKKKLIEMINELRESEARMKQANLQESNVALNPTPMTDLNMVANFRSQFQQLSEYQHIGRVVNAASTMYTKSKIIQESLDFSDYLGLYMQVMGIFPIRFKNNILAIGATYRLALKQISQNWINEPIKLYQFRVSSMSVDQINLFFHHQDTIQINHFMPCYDSPKIYEGTLKTVQNKNLLFYEITLSNQYAVADIGRIIPGAEGLHAIPSKMKLSINSVDIERMEGGNVHVKIELSDFKLTNEMKLSYLNK